MGSADWIFNIDFEVGLQLLGKMDVEFGPDGNYPHDRHMPISRNRLQALRDLTGVALT